MADPASNSPASNSPALNSSATLPVRECIIQGIIGNGSAFRPSDWAERLCGAMSCFRPEGYAGRNAHLVYSPYVRPTVLGGIKCVVVDEALRGLQPLAYHFVMDFARDNDLQVLNACLLPEITAPVASAAQLRSDTPAASAAIPETAPPIPPAGPYTPS